MSDDTINGGSGNDTIFAGIGNDLVSGGQGDDVIFDGVGDDTVFGDGDDDQFWLAGGSNSDRDSLDGGSGSDTVIEDLRSEVAGAYSIYVNLGNGQHYVTETPGVGVDTLVGIENYALLGDIDLNAVGDALANVIASDGGDDSISGLAGNDSIFSGAGNDTVIGGSGADTLSTADGDDLIFVDNVGDVVDGGAGTDRVVFDVSSSLRVELSGWSGVERVDGHNGNDTINAEGYGIALHLLGNSGSDSLTGGTEEDTLEGGTGDDTLVGGAKKDLIFGNGGADRMEGGQGNDFFYVDDGNDIVIGGTEFDRAIITNASGISLTTTSWSGVERIDADTGDDFIDASSFANAIRLQGDDGADTLIGGSANDLAFGNNGDDSLVGNDGNDVLVGDAGADTMVGGEGEDVFFISENGDVAIGGGDLDRARLDPGVTSINLSLSGWSGVERLNASTGNDTIDASSQIVAMSINGNAGDDSIVGGSANDLLFGNTGTDTLVGGDGDDNIWGDAGADLFYGGAGDDWFYVENSADRVVDGGIGYDRVVIIKAALSLTVDGTWAGIERIDGAAGSEVIDASAYGDALFIWADAGNDMVTGGAGGDSIFGNEGSDTLDGGVGGDDVLLGGAGFDRFVFDDGAGTDRINDWEDGIDIIDLSALSSVSGFGDLSISTGPTSTVITAGSETIILTGFTGTLTAGDFDFGI